MRRTRLLRPGLVLTASSLACAGGGETATWEHPAKITWKHPEGPVTEHQNVNPRDERDRAIYVNGGRCWVELPFETPPTSVVPPPTLPVECPEPMLTDPAWAACGGSIQVTKADPLTCTCYVFGNPPPAPEQVACPAETVARAGK